MQKWRVLHSKQIVSNHWVAIRQDECVTARGAHVDDYFVVHKRDFAMVVAITTRGELLLVRQYKHPCGEIVVECPSGYIEDGEQPADAAARELREETGYRACSVRPIGHPFASPAILTNRAYLFLCTDVEREGTLQLDHTEDIELVTIDFDEALRRLESGTLVSDLASTTAILMASRVLAGDKSQPAGSGKD